MNLQKNLKKKNKRVPKDYKIFLYIEPDTVPSTPFNQESSTPESSVTELQEVQTESQEVLTESQEVLTELMEPKLLSDATKKVLTESEGPEPEQP